MSELDFLLELILNHKLTKATKDLIQGRIRDIQLPFTTKPIPTRVQEQPIHTTKHSQSPSTLAILARNPDLIPEGEEVSIPIPSTPPEPVKVIAQTRATAEAMQGRNSAISQALSGKPEQGRTTPRKW